MCNAAVADRDQRRPEEVPLLRRAVVLPAPTETVWQTITEPDEVGRWFGARVEWDLRPGGRATFCDGSGATHHEGVIDDVEPNRLLRFRWWPVGGQGATGPERTGSPDVSEVADGPEVSEVAYELEAGEGGTVLTVTERRIAPVTLPGQADQPEATARRSGSATSGTSVTSATSPIVAATGVFGQRRSPGCFAGPLTAVSAVNGTEYSQATAADEIGAVATASGFDIRRPRPVSARLTAKYAVQRAETSRATAADEIGGVEATMWPVGGVESAMWPVAGLESTMWPVGGGPTTWSVADEAALALWAIRPDAAGDRLGRGALPLVVCCAR
jgi:uncharacterized protein YndB with AHSA1/START domain